MEPGVAQLGGGAGGVAARGRRSRPGCRPCPTSARPGSLEEDSSWERASPRLGRPGMQSRDNGSRVDGANFCDPWRSLPAPRLPSLIPFFTPAWRLQGLPGVGKPSPDLLDSLGNPWQGARGRNSWDTNGWEPRAGWRKTTPIGACRLPLSSPKDLFRATFSPYHLSAERHHRVLVLEVAPSPNQGGNKGLNAEHQPGWKVVLGPAKDVI